MYMALEINMAFQLLHSGEKSEVYSHVTGIVFLIQTVYGFHSDESHRNDF